MADTRTCSTLRKHSRLYELTICLAVVFCGCGPAAASPQVMRVAIAPAVGVGVDTSRVLTAFDEALGVSLMAAGKFDVVGASEVANAAAAATKWARDPEVRLTFAAGRVGADLLIESQILEVKLPPRQPVSLTVLSTVRDVFTGKVVGRCRTVGTSSADTDPLVRVASAVNACARAIAIHFAQGARIVGTVGAIGPDGMVTLSSGADAGLATGAWIYAFRDGRMVARLQVVDAQPGYAKAAVRYLGGTAELAPTDEVGFFFNAPVPEPAPASQELHRSSTNKTLQVLLAVAAVAGMVALSRHHSDGGGTSGTTGTGGTGSLSVDSTPRAAKILLDGTDTGQVTPATLTGVAAGPHVITLRKDSFQDVIVNVTVTAGQTATASELLPPILPPGGGGGGGTGSISVASIPPGANILLDNTATNQVTPATLSNIAAGTHTVTLQKSGYQDVPVQVTVVAGQTATVNEPLPPILPPGGGGGGTGTLSVTSAPGGAAITLDGTATGQSTPATLTNITAGSHTIILKKPGYQDGQQTATVTAGQTTTVNVVLTPVAPPGP